jgi:hypothetical protein
LKEFSSFSFLLGLVFVPLYEQETKKKKKLLCILERKSGGYVAAEMCSGVSMRRRFRLPDEALTTEFPCHHDA